MKLECMSKNLNNDYVLWKSFKAGDDKAFYDLYDQHSDALFGFGMQFCNDVDFVKDCIHDLFLDLYNYRTRLADTSSIRFYLFRSLRRKIYKQQLKKSSQLSFDDTENSLKNSVSPSSEEKLINTEIEQENLAKLKKALRKLTNQQRRILFLKFEEDLTYEEIASILDISIESARTNVYRALKSLRKSLSKNQISLSLLMQFISHQHPRL